MPRQPWADTRCSIWHRVNRRSQRQPVLIDRFHLTPSPARPYPLSAMISSVRGRSGPRRVCQKSGVSPPLAEPLGPRKTCTEDFQPERRSDDNVVTTFIIKSDVVSPPFGRGGEPLSVMRGGALMASVLHALDRVFWRLYLCVVTKSENRSGPAACGGRCISVCPQDRQ